jgi:hypothetical protein
MIKKVKPVPEKVDNMSDKDFVKGEKINSLKVTVDDDIEEVTVSVDRASLPNISEKEVCFMRLMVSYDNGETYAKAGGLGFRGGVHVTRGGHILPFSSVTVKVKPIKKRQLYVEIEAFENGRFKIDADQLITSKSK